MSMTKEEAAPKLDWQEEETARVNLETEPGRVSLETMVKIMTGGRECPVK
jgi:hypothetical protein